MVVGCDILARKIWVPAKRKSRFEKQQAAPVALY